MTAIQEAIIGENRMKRQTNVRTIKTNTKTIMEFSVPRIAILTSVFLNHQKL